MTVLDTSVWVAYFHTLDSQHTRARRTIGDAALPLVIPEYILIETANVLSSRGHKETTNEFLRYAMENASVRIIPAGGEFLTPLVTYFTKQSHRGLSFVDVALLLLSKTYTVITFDRKLALAIASG